MLVVLVAVAALAPATTTAQCRGAGCSVRPPPTSIEATTTPDAELLWPAAPVTGTGVVEHPFLRHGRDAGFIAVGVVLLSVGISAGLVVGGLDQFAGNCVSRGGRSVVACDSWPLAFIPFFGGLFSGLLALNGTRTDSTAGILLGPPIQLVQFIGLVFLLYAVHGYTVDVVPTLPIADLRVQFLPYVSASEGGRGLSVAL